MDFNNSAAEINMTPLIDVLLVLLVIFMVMTPLTPMGLPAVIPQESDSPPSAPVVQSVVISVHRSGEIHINRERVKQAELGQRLRKIFARQARPVVFVQGDADLEFRQVASVIDIARGAGVVHVGLMTRSI
ncbi:MAG: biopolymer transporter ExbD [bacterium]|nr:biopolymer transporter ExbD [bacterium]